ncbi:hypothetical protein EMIT048CA2_140022 [Pseudomonas chlororaphis]
MRRGRGCRHAFLQASRWWEDPAGPSLYEQTYEAAGFVRVDQPQRGDMIVMSVGTVNRPGFRRHLFALN